MKKLSLAFLVALATNEDGGLVSLSGTSPAGSTSSSSGSIFAAAAPPEDLVKSLPLFGRPPTPQYSGYLDGSAGCDTDANGDFCMIHVSYVFWLLRSIAVRSGT